MSRNLTEILTHIFETMNCYGLVNKGYKMVEDVSNYTKGHYSGPGFIYSVEIEESDWSYIRYDVVLDENKQYLGTMAWTRLDGSGWFNDITPNWKNKEQEK